MPVFECPICISGFTSAGSSRSPMLLECGHTLCKECATRIVHFPEDQRRCPTCRSEIKCSDSSELRLNHALAEVIEAYGAGKIDQLGLGEDCQAILLPPDELTLESKLASQPGATCQVWKGRLRGQVVAIKVLQLSPGSDSNDPLVKSLKRELAVLMHISYRCDHVCRYLGFTIKEQKFCIVMRLYKQSLAAMIAEAPGSKLPLIEALNVATGIAKGLCELHGLGVVICDLKPDNVLINSHGDALITDFGISHIVTHTVGAFRPTNMVGTFNYMAPEQMDEQGISFKADIWAFACTIIHMVMGVPPMAGLNAMQIMRKVSVEKVAPQPPEHLPDCLRQLLSRCLSFNPHTRPSSPELLKLLNSAQFALIRAEAEAMAKQEALERAAAEKRLAEMEAAAKEAAEKVVLVERAQKEREAEASKKVAELEADLQRLYSMLAVQDSNKAAVASEEITRTKVAISAAEEGQRTERRWAAHAAAMQQAAAHNEAAEAIHAELEGASQQAATSRGTITITRLSGPNTLQQLADLLQQDTQDPLVVDLGGAVASGQLTSSASSTSSGLSGSIGGVDIGSNAKPMNVRIVVRRAGAVVCNGSVLLPDGVQLVFEAQGCRMEDVVVTGAGVDGTEGADWNLATSSTSKGLIHVAPGGALIMERCKVNGVKAAACAALLVQGAAALCACELGPSASGRACAVVGPGSSLAARGGVVFAGSAGCGLFVGPGAFSVLRDCSLNGSLGASGLVVSGGGACLLARRCTLEANALSNAFVAGGASVDLFGCSVKGALQHHGMLVQGADSRAVIVDCVFEENEMNNLLVHGGACADLSGCTLRRSRRLLGLAVNGAASSAAAKGCAFDGNAESNVAVIEGGTADFEGCSITNSKSLQGLLVHGRMTRASATRCRLEGNFESNASVYSGAACIITSCTLSASQRCHGLEVNGSGSLAVAKGCTLEHNEVTNVAVNGGASLEMSDCTLIGAKKLHGMSVSSFGSSASARDCVFNDSAQINVCVYEGASAGLVGCTMRGAKGLHGMQVQDGGSKVAAQSCVFESNARAGVVASAGGCVELLGSCQVAGNPSDSLFAQSKGSRVTVSAGTKVDKAARAAVGGEILLKQ